MPDHWYFYIWDDQWGPVLVKLCAYAPYPLWVNVNGHEWVKAHLDAAGVGYQAIDNGLAAVDDPGLAHRLCARQAHAEAPATPVDIGIGFNPSNPPTVITTADILNAYLLGHSDGAAGYWNNVELGVGANVPASVYVTFFQQLYTQLHG